MTRRLFAVGLGFFALAPAAWAQRPVQLVDLRLLIGRRSSDVIAQLGQPLQIIPTVISGRLSEEWRYPLDTGGVAKLVIVGGVVSEVGVVSR